MRPSLFGWDQNPGVVPPGSITNDELADMVAHTVKARATNSTGSPEDVPIDATLTFPSNSSLGRAAITGDVDVPQGSNTATIANNAVTDAKFRQSAGVSVVGRSANSTGNVADITAGADDRILARTGGVLSFVQATNGMIPTNTVGLDKLANAAAQYDIIGRKTTGAGAWEDCTRAQLFLARTDADNAFLVGQTINKNAVALPTPIAASVLQVGEADGVTTRISLESFGNNNALTLRRANGTNATPTGLITGNQIAQFGAAGYNGTTYVGTRASIALVASENWGVGSNGTRIEFSTTPNGSASLTNRWIIDNDGSLIYNGGAATGVSTINAVNYFDDGVNINTIYAALAGATFTGQVSASVSGRALYATQTTFGFQVADSVAVLESTDAGSGGPTLSLYHNSASPAAGDTSRLIFWARNTTPADVRYGQLSCTIRTTTPAAEDGEFGLATVRAGTITQQLAVGGATGGVWAGTATGGGQGGGTFNASALYTNGNLVADTNGLLRLRGLTVGTLPAAGTAGRCGHVTDALAPAWNTALVGGGAVNVGARDNGAAWVAM